MISMKELSLFWLKLLAKLSSLSFFFPCLLRAIKH